MLKRFSLLIFTIFFVIALAFNSHALNKDIYINYHFLKGYLELYQGDFKDAAKDLWAVFPYVKEVEFYRELVDVLVFTGRYRQAEEVLKEAIKQYPKVKEFYFKLFDVYTIEGNRKGALKIMKLIQSKFKKTKVSLRKIILMYIKSGKYKEAYKRLLNYVKKYKKDSSGYYLLAQVCVKLKKEQCALENAKKAVELAPRRFRYLVFLASLYEREGKFLEAIKLYKRLPKTSLVLYVIANDYYMAGDLKNSKIYYEKAFLKSGRIDYLEKLMFVLVSLGDYNRIIELAKSYPRLVDESDRLKLFYGIALSHRGNCKKALELFSRISVKVPFYDEVLISKCRCLCRLGRFNEVKEILKRLGKLKAYLFVISRDCVKQKKYNEAAQLFQDAIKVAKNKKEKSVVYFYEADLYYTNLKNKRKAIELLEESIKLDPKNAEALNYLGYLYIDENINIKKGMELVKEALKIKKDNPYYLDSLGWGYYKLKDYKKAELYLKEAIKRYKDSDREAKIVSLEHLLQLYQAEKLRARALDVARELLKLDPNNKKAKELLNGK